MNTFSEIRESCSNESGEMTLAATVHQAVSAYLQTLHGFEPNNLYELVLAEIEKPLIRTVMEHVNGNQTKAAQCLGVSRGTLRKKLKHYGLG